MTHWMSSVFVAFNDLQKVVVFFRELRPHHHEPSHSSFTHLHMGPRVSTHGPCPSVLDILENGGWLAENNSFHVCMQRSTCPQKQQHQQPPHISGNAGLCVCAPPSTGHVALAHISRCTLFKIIFRRESSNWTHEEKETFLRPDLP